MAEAFFSIGKETPPAKTSVKKNQYPGDVTQNDLQTWKLDADTCEAVNATVSVL